MCLSPLLLLHGLSACILPWSHVPSDGFHTMTRSYCHSHAHSQKYGPCASAIHPMICSCPLAMSKPIYLDNLEGYHKCRGACSLHHTDPVIPVHQSARSHKSHPHWHPWSRIWVGSILLVPVSSPLASVFDACGLHLTCRQLNSHLNLLHQGILVRKGVTLPTTSWSQSTCANPRYLLFSSSILAFGDGWDSAYQLLWRSRAGRPSHMYE